MKLSSFLSEGGAVVAGRFSLGSGRTLTLQGFSCYREGLCSHLDNPTQAMAGCGVCEWLCLPRKDLGHAGR